MSACHEYNQEAWVNRTFKCGKYLVPVAAFVPSMRRTHAPRSRISIAELAQSTSRSLAIQNIAEEPPVPPFPIDVVSSSGVSTTPGGNHPSRAMSAYRLTGASSFGRAGTLISQANQVIRETEPHFQVHKWSLRRLTPNYWKRRYLSDLTSRRRISAPSRLRGRAAILNHREASNFYHWLLEVGPKVTALRQAGIEVDHYILDRHLPYQRRILELLGIELSQVIQPHCQSHFLADEIVWLDMPTTGVVRQYATSVLSELERVGGPTPTSTAGRYYISRRDAGHRRMQNERELIAELARHGFTTVCMSDLSIDEQIRLFHHASTIVTIHGAALANLVFANPTLNVVEIVPETRRNRSLFPEWSRHLGVAHCLVNCKTSKYRQRLRVAVDDVVAALR